MPGSAGRRFFPALPTGAPARAGRAPCGWLARWAAEEALSQRWRRGKGRGELGRRRWVFAGRQQHWQRLCSCWSSPVLPGTLGEGWGLCSPGGGRAKLCPAEPQTPCPGQTPSEHSPGQGPTCPWGWHWDHAVGLRWLRWGWEGPHLGSRGATATPAKTPRLPVPLGNTGGRSQGFGPPGQRHSCPPEPGLTPSPPQQCPSLRDSNRHTLFFGENPTPLGHVGQGKRKPPTEGGCTPRTTAREQTWICERRPGAGAKVCGQWKSRQRAGFLGQTPLSGRDVQ